ncbi:MAG TPA: methylmalonyl-CoA mutase family protein [Baekduia sp.]|uniref:methylmalonyl-CoA mutase family protein n=1 Tax=Baekduia sp. TaxID=2600305 RepID=UPI002D765401|nr:methylmalonyl-CoA mutase family protein [Baekduia sp.]HET6508057.1 methylmalonyl-CoA mutase family protein [Baekduia sp.]
MPEPIATGFPPADLAAWEAKARGDDPDAPLATPLDDDLSARFLYTRADALAPDAATRGARRGGLPWEMRQEHGHPDRAVARAQILEDLEGGMTAIALRLDATGVDTLDQLDDVLDGVYLDLAPIALQPGAHALPHAALLLALHARREHDATAVAASLGCDPLGTLAAHGELPLPAEAALSRAGTFAAEVAAGWPGARPLRVDTAPYVDAGATPALEIALALATATDYLRACEAAGLAPERAAPRIELTYNVGTDQFLEIAKLRAARRLWARILDACGVEPQQRRSPTIARTSRRMLSSVDPWVNMLRVTTAAFAAVAGGADGLSVTPFDALRQRPGSLGRRIARNTQLILADEAHLAAVADPAGGSWYVERLTDDLARAAWDELQRLERDGGVLAALRSGALADRLARQTQARADDLAHRRRELTGVNAFPLVGDDGLHPEPEPARSRPAQPRGIEVAPLRDAAPGDRLHQAVRLAAAGATVAELTAALGEDGPPPERLARPLRAHRDAEPFERLRARGDGTRILLAGVGPLAEHAAAMTWARNAFGVAGIAGVEEADEPLALAAVCPGRKADDDAIRATIERVRAGGARHVFLVQRGSEHARTLGADASIAPGDDLLALLTDALEAA